MTKEIIILILFLTILFLIYKINKKKVRNLFFKSKIKQIDISELDKIFDEKLISKNLRLKNEKKDLIKYQKMKKKINEFQKFIKNNFNYVGENFAYEARSIHYNNKKKHKGIYGTASKQDLKELKEEGIDAQMVPWFENENN